MFYWRTKCYLHWSIYMSNCYSLFLAIFTATKMKQCISFFNAQELLWENTLWTWEVVWVLYIYRITISWPVWGYLLFVVGITVTLYLFHYIYKDLNICFQIHVRNILLRKKEKKRRNQPILCEFLIELLGILICHFFLH